MNLQPKLFSNGFKVCDTFLIGLVVLSVPFALRSYERIGPTIYPYLFVFCGLLGLFGLFRVRYAFLILSGLFYLWAFISVIRFFLTTGLFSNILEDVPWIFSIAIEAYIGYYFLAVFRMISQLKDSTKNA